MDGAGRVGEGLLLLSNLIWHWSGMIRAVGALFLSFFLYHKGMGRRFGLVCCCFFRLLRHGVKDMGAKQEGNVMLGAFSRVIIALTRPSSGEAVTRPLQKQRHFVSQSVRAMDGLGFFFVLYFSRFNVSGCS